jgi:hypothetical protein
LPAQSVLYSVGVHHLLFISTSYYRDAQSSPHTDNFVFEFPSVVPNSGQAGWLLFTMPKDPQFDRMTAPGRKTLNDLTARIKLSKAVSSVLSFDLYQLSSGKGCCLDGRFPSHYRYQAAHACATSLPRLAVVTSQADSRVDLGFVSIFVSATQVCWKQSAASAIDRPPRVAA